MCIKCELIKTIAGALGAEIKHVEVGTVAPEYLDEFRNLKEAEDKLERQLEEALEAAAEEVAEQFKAKMEKLEDLQHKVWVDAVTSAGVDLNKQAGDYGIDRTTGVVTITKIVKKGTDEEVEVPTGAGLH